MASRPFVTGLITAGVAATALRAAYQPATAVTRLSETTSNHLIAGAKPAHGDSVWSDALDRDPEAAGIGDAKKSFRATLCSVTTNSEPDCPFTKYVEGESGAPEVMFAIVPDPIHTHLALWFDRSLDALQDALTDSQWIYQNHWLPWNGSSGEKGTTAKFKDAQQEDLYRGGVEQYPGIIVFRPQADHSGRAALTPPHPLVVFVIGDSPTEGINQAQFRNAVAEFKKIAPASSPLRVLGPSFTGSGPSLHALLSEAKESALANVPVHIASGSVSDPNCVDMLPKGAALEAKGQCSDVRGFPAAPDSFVSFESDIVWQVQQTELFLHDKGKLRYDEMAVLGEDESGFGSISTSSQGNQVLTLTFPRNISHLRSAYEKNGIWGFGTSSSGTGSVSLNLDFAEGHETNDSVPEFASKQMPVSQEAMVGQITAILEQRHIKAVFLSATDVLDELFVAEMIARQAPNVIVVVRGTDVLFLRSGEGGVYHNMYAVGPWPLIPRNYYWSQPSQKRGMRTFPSDRSEGYYAATLFLLSNGNVSVLQDYSSPIVSTKRPPLWLMTIGHGAYWPIALMPDAVPDPARNKKLPTLQAIRSSFNLPDLPRLEKEEGFGPEDNRLPVTQVILILAGCVFTLLHAGKCLELPVVRAIGVRYHSFEAITKRPKLKLQALISVIAVVVLSLLCGPPRLPAYWEDCSWALPLFVEAIALSATFTYLWQELRSPGFHVGDPFYKVGRRGAVLFLLFFLAISAFWFEMWQILPATNSSTDGIKEFFALRSHFPLSGASPVFPLLLTFIGIAVYLLNYLDRFTFSPSMMPRLPETAAQVPNCPTYTSMQPLTALLKHPFNREDKADREARSKKFRILLGITLPVVVVVLTLHIEPLMFDGGLVKYGSGLGMLALLLAMLSDLAMGSYFWRLLKGYCLDPLESSPLRSSFSRICGIEWKDLWLMPTSHSGFSQFRTLSRVLEQAARGVLQDEAGGSEAGSLLAELSELRKLRSDQATSRLSEEEATSHMVQCFGRVQAAVARTADKVLDELKPYWRNKKTLITADDGHGDKKDLKPEVAELKVPGLTLRKLRKAWRADINKMDPAVHFDDPAHDRVEPRSPIVPADVQAVREEWVALVYVHYIRMVLIQIRSRLVTAALLYILLVWSVTCYPYLNRHVLIIALSVLFGILALTAIVTYGSINRDSILSRVTESRPGSLDVDFYLKIASMVGIPLLGLIASQFPEISSFLFSWIEPGMAAVK